MHVTPSGYSIVLVILEYRASRSMYDGKVLWFSLICHSLTLAVSLSYCASSRPSTRRIIPRPSTPSSGSIREGGT